METIHIPSPTAFLTASPKPPSPEPVVCTPAKKRKISVSKAAGPTTRKEAGAAKPKQSKSRNGCITCKSKRLKCGEEKPTCAQCCKRNVACGGYKKAFKWRPFEEATLTNKPAPLKIKRNSLVLDRAPDPVASPTVSDASSDRSSAGDAPMQDAFFQATVPSPDYSTGFTGVHLDPDTLCNSEPVFESEAMISLNSSTCLQDRLRFGADMVTSSLNSMFEGTTIHSPSRSHRSSFSGQSPLLMDMLLPGIEMDARPGLLPHTLPSLSNFSTPSMGNLSPAMRQFSPNIEHDPTFDPDIEEVPRYNEAYRSNMARHVPSRSCASPLYWDLDVSHGSIEHLMKRYKNSTCGILSIKDGAHENPWRSLILPLTRSSSPLYHAVACLTAFHSSKHDPSMRVIGLTHMRKSILDLSQTIRTMDCEEALATTLVLAFSESWDKHVSTGIQHVRGAHSLLKGALEKHARTPFTGIALKRLEFFCNTFLYMDVIARLTAIDTTLSDKTSHSDCYRETDYSFLLVHSTLPNQRSEIDPLMGCATTLFPLIGRVAQLCQLVLTTNPDPTTIIIRAVDLKDLIEAWLPPGIGSLLPPSDPTTSVAHAHHTAEAYRWATLLYLHQAVPQLSPKGRIGELADLCIAQLAQVPMASRCVIVQIWPLLAAGCEVKAEEGRDWVRRRWAGMCERMWIGNLERCVGVTEEVWRRRDARERGSDRERERDGGDGEAEEQACEDFWEMRDEADAWRGRREGTREDFWEMREHVENRRGVKTGNPYVEAVDPDITITGKAHWMGVMRDWHWEILLG